MSTIDYEITDFYNHMAGLAWDIDDYTKWMKAYETMRLGYPTWVTKDGKKLRIYEISSSHLDNLIEFIQKKDPDNKTKWVDVFKAEKRYRELALEIKKLKTEYDRMQSISDECL